MAKGRAIFHELAPVVGDAARALTTVWVGSS